MLTLERRWRWSIYSLSLEGVSGRGLQGQRPAAAHRQVPDDRWGSDVRWLRTARRTSADSSRDRWHQISGKRRTSDAWDLSDVRCRRSSDGCRGSDVRWLPVVRSLKTLQLLLLPSSLPGFPRGWCRCSLALALLIIREVPTIPMHAHERGVK